MPLQTESGDPRKLVFVTPGTDNMGEAFTQHTLRGATVIHTSADNCLDDIIGGIAAQAQKYGTLDEIAIDAHGDSLRMFPTTHRDNTSFPVKELLLRIRELQQTTGQKITNNIHFLGCNVMTNMRPRDVGDMRYFAGSLDARIIGYKSFDTYPIALGDAVAFNPDGSVGHAPNSLESNPVTAAVMDAASSIQDFFRGEHHNADWFDCHNGVSQEVGAARQEALTAGYIRDAENSNPAPGMPDRLKLSARDAGSWGKVLDRARRDPAMRPESMGQLAKVTNLNEPTIADTYAAAGRHEADNAVLMHQTIITALPPDQRDILDRAAAAVDASAHHKTGHDKIKVPSPRHKKHHALKNAHTSIRAHAAGSAKTSVSVTHPSEAAKPEPAAPVP